MKVRFLKNHLGYEKGMEDDVNSARGRSWVDQGIAEDVDAEKYVAPEAVDFIEDGKKKTEKNEKAQTHEKKSNAGPGRK
jgi:hypothetical protein